jgi:hypothetical protein
VAEGHPRPLLPHPPAAEKRLVPDSSSLSSRGSGSCAPQDMPPSPTAVRGRRVLPPSVGAGQQGSLSHRHGRNRALLRGAAGSGGGGAGARQIFLVIASRRGLLITTLPPSASSRRQRDPFLGRAGGWGGWGSVAGGEVGPTCRISWESTRMKETRRSLASRLGSRMPLRTIFLKHKI